MNRMMIVEETVAKRQRGTIESIDRISELPDFILHDILSILDTKEAARASVLSKRLYEAWSSIPVLDFNPNYFKGDERFVEFVDNTMRRYFFGKYRIRRMYLDVTINDERLENLVDKWINMAVVNQIQELDIKIHGDIQYRMPEILYRAQSLNVLKCRNIVLPDYETMELVSLKHLTLDLVSVDNDTLQRIISVCPLVKFDITDERLQPRISVPWVRNRKVDGGVEGGGSRTTQSNIQTCPLQEFVYYNVAGVWPMDPWPWNMNAVALTNLRKLEIICTSITDDIVSELAFGLVALESFVLDSCALLNCIKVSSVSLKEFQILTGLNLKKVTIDTPNLREFRYECEVETSLLTKSLDHCNSQFHPMLWEPITTDWFVKLNEFLHETNFFISLEMDLTKSDQIVVDELKNAVTGPPYKLKELKLRGKSTTTTKTLLVAFLDGLFWSCRPDVVSITTCLDDSAAKMILKILEEKARCWKDPLKSIEVERIDHSLLFSHSSEIEIRIRLTW